MKPQIINTSAKYVLTLCLMIYSHEGFASRDALTQTIAFGSCSKQYREQPIWDKILETNPNVFLHLGDAIYSDTIEPTAMRKAYDEWLAIKEFTRFRAQVPIMPTWDDHDYGANDGGADYPMKHESKEIFLDFWQVPQDDARRQRDGVYFSRVLGESPNQVLIIMLDTRFNRGKLYRPGYGYEPSNDTTQSMLGEAQWRWLENQMNHPAKLKIIVSSIQVLPYQHGKEKWANLPHERARLLELAHRSEGILFLSGDRHQSDISVLNHNALPYELIDVTSSGLSERGMSVVAEPNSLRPEGTMSYYGAHFGLIKVKWRQGIPHVQIGIINIDSNLVGYIDIPYSRISGKKPVID